jgi:hypothetical protein
VADATGTVGTDRGFDYDEDLGILVAPSLYCLDPVMAAKIINRKERRAEVEAAERKGKSAKQPEAKVSTKKEPAKRKSRAKSAKEVRLKAFWGVFNQSLKRVALYEFSEKKEADKKAKELTASGKSPHFVQPVKEAVQD